MTKIEEAGEEKQLILRPRAHRFYAKTISLYEPKVMKNSPNFWFLGQAGALN